MMIASFIKKKINFLLLLLINCKTINVVNNLFLKTSLAKGFSTSFVFTKKMVHSVHCTHTHTTKDAL